MVFNESSHHVMPEKSLKPFANPSNAANNPEDRKGATHSAAHTIGITPAIANAIVVLLSFLLLISYQRPPLFCFFCFSGAAVMTLLNTPSMYVVSKLLSTWLFRLSFSVSIIRRCSASSTTIVLRFPLMLISLCPVHP